MGKFNEYTPSSGGDWMNFVDGDNKIRIVSGFEAFGRHYNSETNKVITCVGKDRDCQFCAEADIELDKLRELKLNQEPNKEDKAEMEKVADEYRKKKSGVQFLVWVIDRKDGGVKLLRYGVTVQNEISKLAKAEEYAFSETPNYDITVNKSGKGLGTEYAVIADRKDSPLTDDEKKEIADKIKPISEIIEAMKNKAEKEDDTSDAPENVSEDSKEGDK